MGPSSCAPSLRQPRGGTSWAEAPDDSREGPAREGGLLPVGIPFRLARAVPTETGTPRSPAENARCFFESPRTQANAIEAAECDDEGRIVWLRARFRFGARVLGLTKKRPLEIEGAPVSVEHYAGARNGTVQ